LRTSAAVWVVDLLGRGGVKVGGAVVRFARVDDGDEIRLGKYVCHLRQDALDKVAANPPAGQIGFVPSTVPTGLAGREPGGATSDPVTLRPTVRVASAWPGERTETEYAETPLAPLIQFQQLGEMQQWMFDQFQQAMLMMLQMFGTLHRDQMGEIREALEQIHDLTEELRTLQSDSNRPRSESASVAGVVGRRPGQGSTASRPHDLSSVGSAPQRRRFLGGLMPEENSGETPDGVMNSPRDVPFGAKTKLECDSELAGRSSGNEGDARVAAPVAGARGGEASAQPDEEFHAQLSRKIAAIQEERQTRWEKIMNIVKGI
jgi:hypothetical protein